MFSTNSPSSIADSCGLQMILQPHVAGQKDQPNAAGTAATEATAETGIEYSHSLCLFVFLSDIQGLLWNQNGDDSSSSTNSGCLGTAGCPTLTPLGVFLYNGFSPGYLGIWPDIWPVLRVSAFWHFPMQKQKPLTWQQMAWQLPRQLHKGKEEGRVERGGEGRGVCEVSLRTCVQLSPVSYPSRIVCF